MTIESECGPDVRGHGYNPVPSTNYNLYYRSIQWNNVIG